MVALTHRNFTLYVHCPSGILSVNLCVCVCERERERIGMFGRVIRVRCSTVPVDPLLFDYRTMESIPQNFSFSSLNANCHASVLYLF